MKFINDRGEGIRDGNGSAVLFSELGLLASLVNAMKLPMAKGEFVIHYPSIIFIPDLIKTFDNRLEEDCQKLCYTTISKLNLTLYI